MARACRIIEEAEKSLPLAALAATVGFSPFHFQRLFKETVGVTPKAYAMAHRARRFQESLREEQRYPSHVRSGLRVQQLPAEKVADHLGMTPSEYRKGGAGQRVRHAMVRCDLGWMLVAATELGGLRYRIDDSPTVVRVVAGAFPPPNFGQ
ncbi:MAG: AraC family transcriptional regulator [Candidatus Competibacteraceae bacterium]